MTLAAGQLLQLLARSEQVIEHGLILGEEVVHDAAGKLVAGTQRRSRSLVTQYCHVAELPKHMILDQLACQCQAQREEDSHNLVEGAMVVDHVFHLVLCLLKASDVQACRKGLLMVSDAELQLKEVQHQMYADRDGEDTRRHFLVDMETTHTQEVHSVVAARFA